MKWLTRPKEKPPIINYIDSINRMYSSDGGNADPDKDPKYIDPKEMDLIKKSLPVSEMVKEEERFNDKILKRDKYETPKKKIIKKIILNFFFGTISGIPIRCFVIACLEIQNMFTKQL